MWSPFKHEAVVLHFFLSVFIGHVLFCLFSELKFKIMNNFLKNKLFSQNKVMYIWHTIHELFTWYSYALFFTTILYRYLCRNFKFVQRLKRDKQLQSKPVLRNNTYNWNDWNDKTKLTGTFLSNFQIKFYFSVITKTQHTFQFGNMMCVHRTVQ